MAKKKRTPKAPAHSAPLTRKDPPMNDTPEQRAAQAERDRHVGNPSQSDHDRQVDRDRQPASPSQAEARAAADRDRHPSPSQADRDRQVERDRQAGASTERDRQAPGHPSSPSPSQADRDRDRTAGVPSTAERERLAAISTQNERDRQGREQERQGSSNTLTPEALAAVRRLAAYHADDGDDHGVDAKLILAALGPK